MPIDRLSRFFFGRNSHFRLLLAATFVLSAVPVKAQDTESDVAKTRGKVIGRIWHTKVDGSQVFQYTQQLTKELEMPQSPVMMFAGGMGSGVSMLGQEPDVELKGTMMFLETLPNPGTPHFISFMKMKDLAAFTAFVKKQTSMMGPIGELIGEGDKLEVKMNLKSMTFESPELPDGEQPNEVRIEVRTQVSVGDSPPVGEWETPDSFSTYYRFHDGFAYSGQMKALHFVDLPSQESMLIKDDAAGEDIHGVFDLTQIPRHLKQALWMSMQSQTQTYMQRFDNEALGDYSVRHALGQGRLEFLKAAMFDVDSAQFSLKFAKSDEEPIQANVKIAARQESQLAQTLKQMNRTPSRLGVLRNNESPLVFSSTLDLPDWTQPLAKEFVTSLKLKMQESADDSVGQMVEDLFAPILAAAEEGQLDGAIRMEGDVDAGMVLAGGLRLPDAERFHSTLETLLLVKSTDGQFSTATSKLGDADVITVSFDQLQLPFAEQTIPLQVHMSGSGSYLWFAVGGENAIDALEGHVANQQTVLDAQVKPMPVLIRMRLSDWLNQDGNAVSQVPSQLLTRLEQKISELFSPMFNFQVSMNGSSVKPKKKADFVSYADKVLKGRSGDLELRSQANGNTLSVSADVGTGVVKFLMAQYAAAQNRMFSNMKFDFDPEMLEAGEGTSVRKIRIGN